MMLVYIAGIALFSILPAILIFLFYSFHWRRRSLPPGPTPLPIVGNVLTLARYPPGEECHLKWQREYGPVYTYWIGQLPIVCVADFATIMDTFHRDGWTYAGRTTFPEVDKVLKGGTHGVFNVEGE